MIKVYGKVIHPASFSSQLAHLFWSISPSCCIDFPKRNIRAYTVSCMYSFLVLHVANNKFSFDIIAVFVSAAILAGCMNCASGYDQFEMLPPRLVHWPATYTASILVLGHHYPRVALVPSIKKPTNRTL